MSQLPLLLGGSVCPGIGPDHIHESAIGTDPITGDFISRRLQTYPSEMCRHIATAFVFEFKRMLQDGTGPGGFVRTEVHTTRIWSWSTYETEVSKTAVAFLNEETARNTRVVVTNKQKAIYIHVDDGVCIGENLKASDSTDGQHCTEISQSTDGTDGRQPSDDVMLAGAAALEDIGFWVKDQQMDSELEKVVGYEIQRRPACFRFPFVKCGLLYNALMQIYHQWRVEVDIVNSLLGIWLWGALLKRELLSIPHSLFRFINRF